MIFEQVAVGGNCNFSYLIGDETSGKAAVIDPAFRPEELLNRAQRHGLSITHVINTHSHYDHTNGNDYILKKTAATLAGYALSPPAMCVKDGDILPLGKLNLHVLHTPGHTPDSICILAEGRLVSGDTLFVGTIGKTGFGDDARQMFETLQKKIKTLPGTVEVYPGHDYGPAPVSTIDKEKETNPFLLLDSFQSFLDLKKQRMESRT